MKIFTIEKYFDEIILLSISLICHYFSTKIFVYFYPKWLGELIVVD